MGLDGSRGFLRFVAPSQTLAIVGCASKLILAREENRNTHQRRIHRDLHQEQADHQSCGEAAP